MDYSYYIQSGAKKGNILKIDFFIFIFIKIKHNWMNFMMVKTVSKIFYYKYFIRL